MSNERWITVDKYIANTLIPEDPILEAALEANAAAGLPAIDVAPNQGKFLQMLARIQRSRRILEIGTLGGYSTIWLARALPSDGKLITLEVDPTRAAVALRNIQNAGLADHVEIRTGPAAESLAQLYSESAGPFDFIFIDADKPGNPVYLNWAIKLSRKGTIVICDNVVRDGELANSKSDDPSVQGTRTMFDMLEAEPRIEATALQTVGSKGL